MKTSAAARSLFLLGLCSAVVSASALTSGTTLQGRAFVSGGISAEELVQLHDKRNNFSLRVVTAAKRSGAHMADVRLRITDADNRTVFEGQLDGPWLFIDLPLGRYRLQASLNGETQQRFTTIHPADHHQVFFYFDVPDELSPDPQRPFLRNPYGP
jgi:hypothetical protein